MKYRTRQLIRSKIRRALRWEFWPMSVFYIPVVTYILLLIIRYRGLTFLSVNPGLPMSGLIGESKALALEQLQGNPVLARFCLLSIEQGISAALQQGNRFMQHNELDFPVVMKPNTGQRGMGVAVIRDEKALYDYLTAARDDIILQEHIEGEEFGIFYTEYPATEQTEIFSITEKTFPVIIGDGKKTIEQLLMENSRTHYMASFLLDLHKSRLAQVLAVGESFKVVEIGSHCRGSVFLEGGSNITPELTAAITQTSQQIEGFYFGRYDIRVPNKQALQRGELLKVIEVNGVTSESTNIYDPDNSLFKAYAVLFKQWRSAFEIGKQNIKRGVEPVYVLQFLKYLYRFYFLKTA